MKVGDYLRTFSGIYKIWYICKKDDKLLLEKNGELLLYDFSVGYKTSSNIIDLIEVGDYVNGRIVDDYIYLDKLGLIGLTELEKEDEKFIKSIVTKEQFSQMEYKVGE